MEAKLDAIAPVFLVDDVRRAAEFYRDRLGSSLTEYFGEPPVFTIVRRDAVRIASRLVGDVRRGSNRARNTESFDAYIWVSDIGALYKQFLTDQAPVSGPPELREYGIREIWIRDLDGYVVTFGQFESSAAD
jgi:catechol 2,3-dioxygenase-like lactoylglutathione lyase family enzyme